MTEYEELLQKKKEIEKRIKELRPEMLIIDNIKYEVKTITRRFSDEKGVAKKIYQEHIISYMTDEPINRIQNHYGYKYHKMISATSAKEALDGLDQFIKNLQAMKERILERK